MKTIMTMFRLTEQEREFIKEMGRGSLSNGLRYLLEKQLAEKKDHCEKCGCNEFLCGHNRRG